MKELVFQCDVCLGKGKEVPATHAATSVVVGKAAPLLIDLCDGDYATLIDPITEALAAYGYKDEPPKPAKKDKAGPFQCMVPGCASQRLFKQRRSLNGHLLEKHEMSMAEYKEKYGELVPVTDEALAG